MSKGIRNGLLLLICLIAGSSAKAQSSDFGVWLEAGAKKKLGDRWAIGIEAGLRTRDNSKNVDRWSLGIAAEYKIASFLKASAGYSFLYDQRETKTTYHSDGSVNKITPYYWWPRHRLHVALTGDVDLGRLNISLRERYQYTYRAKASNKKYDTDTEEWEDVKSKTSHILRSRLQLEYNIKKCPLKPFANVELFHGEGGLQKTRYTLGTALKIDKKNTLEAYYRFQKVKEDDEDEPDRHILGISYSYKF